MNLLLDTQTLGAVLQGRRNVVDRLEEAIGNGDHFLLSSLVHFELVRFLELKTAPRLLRAYEQLVTHWERCAPTFEDWREAADLWAERRRTGRFLPDAELVLAVQARKHEAVLVTQNAEHYEDLGVPTQDWTVPLV